MIAFVKKANNRYKAVSQRDAFNAAMNAVMNKDGGFDLNKMLKDYPKEFKVLVHLVFYQLTKNSSYVSPPGICIQPTKKYEKLFEQLERPLFDAIKRSLLSGEKNEAIIHYWLTKKYFLAEAVLSDLPDKLREIAEAKIKESRGEDVDIQALEKAGMKVDDILDNEAHKLFYFHLNWLA